MRIKASAEKLPVKTIKSVAVIVAHPDDETLWAGGLILRHSRWRWFIVSLCRASDTDRAPRFFETLKILKAGGAIGDVDDSPSLKQLTANLMEDTIISLLPPEPFDLLLTHNPSGEYTSHPRHGEVSRAVINLWESGKIATDELWTFAYEDGNKQYLPRPQENADIYQKLRKTLWEKKYKIITETYGYNTTSWEAETTTKTESFWKFTNPRAAGKWLAKGGIQQ